MVGTSGSGCRSVVSLTNRLGQDRMGVKPRYLPDFCRTLYVEFRTHSLSNASLILDSWYLCKYRKYYVSNSGDWTLRAGLI